MTARPQSPNQSTLPSDMTMVMSPVQTICACVKLPNKEMNVASIPISFKKTLPGAGNTGLCRFYTPCGDPIPTPKARHREFREPGRSCGAEGMVRNFPAADILPESPKRRVLRWHARKRKRGPLSETPFPFDKSRLTLAGSNHPSDADDDGEDANPRPIDASAGHDDNNIAVPNEVCLC